MFTPEQARMMMELFANPLFRQGANEFIKRMQQDGMEAARQFWRESPYAGVFPDQQQVMERMADFYSAMGFVPVAKYDALREENEALKTENAQLRSALRDLQQSVVAEGGAKAQRAWQEVMERQMAINREATQSFFDALNAFGTSNKKS